MKERILIGEEQQIRFRLNGSQNAEVLCDMTRPLGTFLINFERDTDRDWNLYGLSPLRQALHSNRWKQPELEQAASEFLWEKYLSNDPLKMYVAFRIWNSYLLAREPRDRNAACDRFMDKMSRLTGVFQNETMSFDRETGKPKHFQAGSLYFKGAPSEDTRLDLWFPDNRRTEECVSAYASLYPLITYRLVSLQLLILCGAGIPIGLLLGILSAKGVLIAATGLLNPDLFMANSTSELNSAINTASTVKLPMLFASIAVILLFALLAAFPAARYASHVSPTVAMSGQTVKIKRRIKRNRNIRNFEAYYARLNLKRGRGRTAVTILSLVMSITVFVALQSFTGLLDASSSVQDMYFSDYAVTNETVGIPSEAVKTLAENDAVESVSTTRLSVFMPGAGDILPFETDLSVQSHETLQLVNVDEAQLQIYAPNLSAQDKQALKDGTGCLVKNPIAFSYGDTTVQQTDLTVGDTIQLGDRTLPVLGLIDTAITINNDGFTNGVQLIVNDEIYCSLLGNDSYSEVYPTLQDNADTDTFESWLDSWCSNYPGTHWLSYLQSSNEMIESFEQIKMLCWVLIIFIGIIGILNIINTVYSNIHTRVGEIGMQRAIGMSAASLYKTFLWEGAYYGIIASVIGAVFGYVCCIFVGAAQTDALQLVAVPVMAIVEAAIISIVACLLATAIPLRSIARMSIVDSIETVE